MILLHRLSHSDEPFHLNPDLIVSVEALPDSVITLTTHVKVLVRETPEEIADAIRTWRSGILGVTLHELPRRSAALTLVRAGAGEAPGAGS